MAFECTDCGATGTLVELAPDYDGESLEEAVTEDHYCECGGLIEKQ